jgi:hypothetical protein
MTSAQRNYLLSKICADMAATIRGVTGQNVTVTCRTADNWTISGDPAAVIAARPVLEATGLLLTSSHYDPTPDADGDIDTDRYDYWDRSA